MNRHSAQSKKHAYLRSPAYPFAGPQLFKRLRLVLAETFGTELTFPDLGRLTSKSRSTTQHWFQDFDHPHVVFFLSLLEQLPEKTRMELISEFCRELPLLNHPRLAHDPLAVNALENVVQEPRGLSLITGGSEFQRTFLATALGHAATRSGGSDRAVAGIDVHEPKSFVPVPGVTYFKQPLSSSALQALTCEFWPEIASSKARLLVFNGIWSAVPRLRGRILELADEHHVIIADAISLSPAELARAAAEKTHLLSVSQAGGNPAWIRVQVTAL